MKLIFFNFLMSIGCVLLNRVSLFYNLLLYFLPLASICETRCLHQEMEVFPIAGPLFQSQLIPTSKACLTRKSSSYKQNVRAIIFVLYIVQSNAKIIAKTY